MAVRFASSSRLPMSSTLRQDKRTIFSYFYGFAKKVTPKISPTEAAALNSGTVGFDKDIFSGDPKLRDLLLKYKVSLTAEEQSFLDNEANTLCKMANPYQINKDRDMPEPIWQYIRKNRFMGMIIDKKWGGLQFSPHGHSQVVQKLASRNDGLAVSVMVPNSLGPGELLKRYGTSKQQTDLLPKLANGEFIPCFGLTGPHSGSDAASMRDEGIVEERDGVLGVVATFKKRYITLAPVASVVGLAVNIKDPKGLLKGKGSDGISIALLLRGHTGLRLGPRHDPVGSSFMNGTVEGEGVWIPVDSFLGGQERLGFGWNMLMECLAEGRGVSLPALSVATAQMSTLAVGAYARVRKQFKVPLADLEGVQEHLARIGGRTLKVTAAQHLMNAMLNMHEQPAVLSAVMKLTLTGTMRDIIIDAMDVLGGSGICRGPQNYAAAAYEGVPVAITVEGANTLTRTLIVFGQGVMRSHPHLHDMVKAIHAGNKPKDFSKETVSLVKHFFVNAGRSLGRAVLRTRMHPLQKDKMAYYDSQLSKLAANFAVCADLSLSLGGALKFREMISGRFADAFSQLYLGYACLWYYETNKVAGVDDILEYAMSEILYDCQEALFAVYRNFPVRPVGWLMAGLTFPTGRVYQPPSDVNVRKVSDLISTPSKARDFLIKNVYISDDPKDKIRMLVDILPKACEAERILKEIRKQKRVATHSEQTLLAEVEKVRDIIVQVDAFDRLGAEEREPANFVRPALRPLNAQQ